MNSVNLIGRLVRDPETRYAQGDQGTAVTKFTVAVDRRIKKENEDVDFLNCVAFGKTGEFVSKYFTKARRIGVTGHIQTGKYTNKEGQTVRTTDIIADSVYFCDNKTEPTATKQNGQMPSPEPIVENIPISIEEFSQVEEDDSADLPF